jgi:uncharacterized protein (TIRG00374 family)
MVPVVLALLVLVALILVSDGRQLLEELRRFDLWILVPVLGLSLVNYGLRFARWQLYLRKLESTIDLPGSLAVFLAGFVLSVTPGKAGELGKAWLVRHLGGGPARRTVAAVIAERVTDLSGVLVLTAIGAAALPRGPWIAAICLAAAIGLAAILAWAPLFHWILRLLKRLPRIGPHLEALDEAYERLRTLLEPAIQIQSVVLATLAWAAEGIGFWLVVRAYDPAASVAQSVFNYGVSTLAGAISMLPGGLLASEGALTALLDYQGLETAAAASATLVIRGATLWFAVGLGLVAVPYLVRRLRASSRERPSPNEPGAQ